MKAIVNIPKNYRGMNGKTFEISELRFEGEKKRIVLKMYDEHDRLFFEKFKLEEVIIVDIDDELRVAKENNSSLYVKLIEYCMYKAIWIGNTVGKYV